MTDHLDSTNLVPFKRRRRNGYHLPDLKGELEEQMIDEVDPDLRPEEQGFVRHYLGYADILLKNAPDTVDEETQEFADNSSSHDRVTGFPQSNGTGAKSSKNNAA